jgi:hypothetical protein
VWRCSIRTSGHIHDRQNLLRKALEPANDSCLEAHSSSTVWQILQWKATGAIRCIAVARVIVCTARSSQLLHKHVICQSMLHLFSKQIERMKKRSRRGVDALHQPSPSVSRCNIRGLYKPTYVTHSGIIDHACFRNPAFGQPQQIRPMIAFCRGR